MPGENIEQSEVSQEEAPKPSYVSAEEVAVLVNKTVTGAVARQIKSFQEELSKSLPNIISEIAAKQKPEDKQEEVKKADPRILAMEQKQNELLQKLEEEQKARAAAENKARDDSARSTMRSLLSQKVRPEMLDMAVDLLFDARKKVAFDEENRPLFLARQKTSFGVEDVQLPLSDGLESWLKSDEAKVFIPAPSSPERVSHSAPRHQANGSKMTPSYTEPATTDEEKVRRAQEQFEALRAQYPGL